jgi:hypothetical protein
MLEGRGRAAPLGDPEEDAADHPPGSGFEPHQPVVGGHVVGDQGEDGAGLCPRRRSRLCLAGLVVGGDERGIVLGQIGEADETVADAPVEIAIAVRLHDDLDPAHPHPDAIPNTSSHSVASPPTESSSPS